MKSLSEPRRADAGLLNLGFASAAGQALMFRELGLLFEGDEIVASAMLAAWLLLTGAGALLGLQWFRPRAGIASAAGTFAVGPALLLSLLATRFWHPLLSDLPGRSPTFASMALSCLALLAPLCLLTGALFPVLLARRGAASPARGYALESAGFLLGGTGAAFVLVPCVSNLAGAFLVAAVSVVAAACLSDRLAARIGGALFASALVVFLLLPVSSRLDHLTRAARFEGESLLAFADAPRGTLTVTETGGLRTFRMMGARIGDDGPHPAPAAFVHLAMLAHPRPETVALLGGGETGALHAVLEHGARADLARAGRGAFRLLEPFLRAEDRDALASPRARLLGGDGRAFLERSARAGRSFDVLLAVVPDPSTGALNRYYTVEFFRACASALSPGGVAGVNLSGAPGYRSAARRRLLASVRRSMAEAFCAVETVRTDEAGTVILGSDAAIVLSPERLSARARSRGLSSPFGSGGWVASVLERREAGLRFGAEAPGEAPLNRDLKPVSPLFAFSLRASRFGGSGGLVSSLLLLGPALLLLGALVYGWRRAPSRRRSLRASAPIVTAGAAGMAFEVGLLFAFQSEVGYVYAHLGALAAFFMAGAAGGAWIARKTPHAARWARIVGGGFGLFGLFGCFALPVLPLGSSLVPSLGLFLLLELVAGLLTGAIYPLGLSRSGASPGPEEGGMLYAVDLAGASGGALAAGALAVPLAGIPATMLGAGLLAFLGALCLPGGHGEPDA